MRAGVIRSVMLLLVVLSAGAQTTIRFGVLGLFHPHEIEIAPAGGQPLRIDGLSQPRILTGEPGKRRLVLRLSGDHIVVGAMQVERIVITARDGGPVRFQLRIPGKLHRVYAGQLTITVCRGELLPIVAMDTETAVAIIVASEMPRDAPVEALKAQAVVTRSFLRGGPRHGNFDFCDTTHCQYLRSPDDVAPRVQAAVRATEGIVITWAGKIVPALYSRRCGGHTRSLRDIGMDPGNGYPYFAVECRWCRRHPVAWQTAVPDGVRPPRADNEASRLEFARVWGWGALPGSAFTVERRAGETVIKGHSLGHGVGMCQLGAIGMAKSGAGYGSILELYYPGTRITRLESR